ncbi:hypothetical protein BE21_45535 [Sorangium cellulosum]|uniref:Uncharacterized protein n=1 Tax=Sorangium cellulosum TaxID=56 RepID=A0A150TJA2_SORCE|nr:hypothetical protein BE21_45535 [Sorangium cellulosum]
MSSALRMIRRGILILVADACDARLGELVRALSPEHPGIEVHTRAPEAVRAEPGSLLVLQPSEQDVDWMNLNRPVFADRALQVILWCDGERARRLARGAPDFYDWISLWMECPAGPPGFAVHGPVAPPARGGGAR